MELTGYQVDAYEYAAPAETTIGELRQGDFIVSIPAQMGIRGYRVNSGVREISEPHSDRWKMGPARRKYPVPSRAIRFMSDLAGVDYPSDCTVIARKRIGA